MSIPDFATLNPGYWLRTSCLSRRQRAAILQSDRQGTNMSNEAKTLIEQARALPPRDRIALVEDVLDSLDRADPVVDRLWAREASDRLTAYRRGELAAKDLGDIVAKYRP
jgi:putative addiction module component (TIGR02574 family)